MKLKDASWKKLYNPRQHFIKQRCHFANKGQQHSQTTMLFAHGIVKAIFVCLFPVVMYAYESWTLKKAEY